MSIALAIAVITLAAVVAALVYALLAGLKSERASFASEVLAGKGQIAAERAQWAAEKSRDAANDERDEARAAQAKAEKERDVAVASLADTQRALNEALEENAHETVEAIRAAPTSVAALAELERLFQATARGNDTVPADGNASAAAGDDRGEP